MGLKHGGITKTKKKRRKKWNKQAIYINPNCRGDSKRRFKHKLLLKQPQQTILFKGTFRSARSGCLFYSVSLRYYVFPVCTSGKIPKKQKHVKSFSVKTFNPIQIFFSRFLFASKSFIFVPCHRTTIATNFKPFQHKFAFSLLLILFQKLCHTAIPALLRRFVPFAFPL